MRSVRDSERLPQARVEARRASACEPSHQTRSRNAAFQTRAWVADAVPSPERLRERFGHGIGWPPPFPVKSSIDQHSRCALRAIDILEASASAHGRILHGVQEGSASMINEGRRASAGERLRISSPPLWTTCQEVIAGAARHHQSRREPHRPSTGKPCKECETKRTDGTAASFQRRRAAARPAQPTSRAASDGRASPAGRR